MVKKRIAILSIYRSPRIFSSLVGLLQGSNYLRQPLSCGLTAIGGPRSPPVRDRTAVPMFSVALKAW